MKILIVDNHIERDSWGSKNLLSYAIETTGTSATVYVRRGPCDDLPENPLAFDRVVISGSLTSCLIEDEPWVARLDSNIRKWVDNGTPLLGVCYGHQSIARALGGTRILREAERNEHGWTLIEQTSSSAIFEGLPAEFYSFSSHFQEVTELPPGAKLTARSELCGIQAFELQDKPVFGIQFHPEKRREDALKAIDGWKKKDPKRALLHPEKTAKLFDPKVAESIFRNFFTQI